MFYTTLTKEITETYGNDAKAHKLYIEKCNTYRALAQITYSFLVHFFNNDNKRQCVITELKCYETLLEYFDISPKDFDYILLYWFTQKITDKQNGYIVI